VNFRLLRRPRTLRHGHALGRAELGEVPRRENCAIQARGHRFGPSCARQFGQVFRYSHSTAGNAEEAKGFTWPMAEARSAAAGVSKVPSAWPRTRTVTSVRSSARHGEAADSEQILMEDYHCSGREVFSDLVKVGENDRGLLRGSASGQAADEDHRRIASP
jgi:hypothetical protein